jgi:hypothetical protein
MYKKCYDPILQSDARSIRRISDNAIIPFDEENIDYQNYLAWLAEGNIPEEFDTNAD